MTGHCHITFSTIQYDISDDPIVEEADGFCRAIDDSLYVSYGHVSVSSPDLASDTDQNRDIIKINPRGIEVRRRSEVQGRLLYIPGRSSESQLDLGFSTLSVKNVTDTYELTETDDMLKAEVTYDLTINESFVSRCRMVILLTALD